MNHVKPISDWPQSWKESYDYDCQEVYGKASIRGYTYAYRNRYNQTLKLVQSVAAKGAKVLDIAAAQGNFTLSLAELGYEVTWNDLREELIGYVKLKYERGIVHYAPGNVFDLNFTELFDVVVITEIIEHVAHPDEFLAKVARLVKPNGHIVMTTPNGEYFLNKLPKFSDCPDPSQFESMQFKPNSDGHIFLLHPDEIPRLAKYANLKVQKLVLFTNTLTNGYLKTEIVLKVVPRSLINTLERFTRRLPPHLRRRLHTGMAVVFSRPSETATLQNPPLPGSMIEPG